VLQNLSNHKNLGIHTELFYYGAVEMVKQGRLACGRKTFHPGNIIAGLMFGSMRLYDFVDNNPIIELHPTNFVKNSFHIAHNDKIVSVNSANSVDLTGQLCADSIGTRLYSNVGGQLHFARDAGRSNGGMSFIAFLSTARMAQPCALCRCWRLAPAS
jgi:acetyl-CoA hydrolase